MEKYMVEMKNIHKTFPGVKALDDVSFNLRPGEVMALLGENGAGKSTLVKVLSGVIASDSGEIWVEGEKVSDITPKRAQELGIAIIHQELNMCTHLSVAENIFLGREKTKTGILDEKSMNNAAGKILGELGIDINPREIVANLPLSKQQMVEIAKALSTNAKIMIMDEPTSALTSKEIDDLFTIIRKLRGQGKSVVYISHRLEELQHIVDRVTIMRDGKFVCSGEFASISMAEIIANMVGREIKEKYPKVEGKLGKKILEVSGLNAGNLVRDVSFDLCEGEIVGIAGLLGAGRSETLRAIFGADKTTSGSVELDGKLLKITCPMDAIKAGIVLAPEDRKKDGLCVKLSIRENMALPNLDWLCNPLGVVNKNKEKEMLEKAKEKLKIKMPGGEVNAGSLSGGNQQKIVVGKWLARDSRVVMFDEPTRGIDVAAKVEIYNLMNQLKQEGIGVLFVSSEMTEVLGIADRILVMCDGRITGELDPKTTSQNEILEFATRFESKFDSAKDKKESA